MKRIATSSILILLAICSLHAIDRKYRIAYEAVPVSIDTRAYEFGLSDYLDGQYVFFRPDTIKQKPNFFQRIFGGASNEADTTGKKKVKYFTKVKAYSTTVGRNGELTTPVPVPELDKIGVSGRFAYDKKTKKIYFSKYNEQKKIYQLHESTYDGTNWEKPQLLIIKNVTGLGRDVNALVNAGWQYINSGASVTNPTIANDGKRIYFTSNNIKNGIGKSDIWYIDWKLKGWSAPRNVGKRVNSEYHDDYAYVSGDSLLYIASDRPGGKGGYDLYVSRMVKKQWNKVEPLNRLFNSPKDDYNIIGDNRGVFFISNRDTLKRDDDIYTFKLLPAGKEPYIPEVQNEPMPEPDPVFHYVLFFFDFDKDIFKPEFEGQLAEVISEINTFPDSRFEIAGYTDEKGSDAYNDKLSLKRARNIKQMLVDRGIPEDVLEVKGYGKRYPVIPNAKTEAENAQNRRVEINIIPE